MTELFFKDDGFIPNSRFPVILNRKRFDFGDSGADIVEVFLRGAASVTRWRLEWLWRVYKRPHYHSTTHEMLAVFQGSATLRLGGHRVGKVVKVNKRDIIVIPAGVAHQALESTKDFLVFGFYPIGARKWDMLFCRKKERAIALPNIAELGPPPEFNL